MKKIFVALILVTALIFGGCESESSSSSVTSINGDIHVEGETCNGSIGVANLDIDGGTLIGEAKITSGRVEIQVGNKTYTFDNSGQISVDVPAGVKEITFTGVNKFTGDLKLKAVPKA